jgi:hypothetical protein
VVWAETIAGKRIPLNPVRVPGGNITLQRRRGLPTLANVVQPDPLQDRYVSHFATCPSAAAHRKATV